MITGPKKLDPGRITRAAIHCDAGEVELRLTAAGNWQLAIRRDDEREWHLACSGDLKVGAISPGAQAIRDPLRIGKLLLDTDARRVSVGGHEVPLSNLEYRLLVVLASNPSRAFTKQQLMKTVWGCDDLRTTRTLDTHASRIRVKLRQAGADGYVINCMRIGYKLWDGIDHLSEDALPAA